MNGEEVVDTLAALAQQLRATPEQMRLALARVEGAAPTLGDAVARVESATGRPISGLSAGHQRYPEAVRRFLDGDPEAGIHGYADRRIGDSGVHELQADVARLQVAIGRREAARQGFDLTSSEGKQRARESGHGAARNYVWAIHAVGKALERAGITASALWQSVEPPGQPGPTRDLALTVDELRDYLIAILTNTDDPRLEALVWALVRTTALRNAEVLTLNTDRVSKDRTRLTIFGKGSKFREMPVSAVLITALLELRARRCTEAHETALLLRPDGTVMSGRDFDQWSTWLHRDVAWAHGHKIDVHCLRHSTARLIDETTGGSTVSTTVYLGHSVDEHHRTTGRYLHTRHVDDFAMRAAVYERCFGALTRWPRLPENDLLGGALQDLVRLPTGG